jgi:predicted permease
MDLLSIQLRDAWRRLCLAPGFTAIAVLTLALGIGANTAIFTVVHAVLLEPLPFPEADRLVGVWHDAPGIGLEHIENSHATYLLYRARSRTLEELGIYSEMSVNLTGDGPPERLRAVEATAPLLTVLRVVPALGRAFTEEDERPGSPPVVLLAHGLFQRRWGGDPTILGRTLTIDGVQRQVVGVLPAACRFPDARVQLWLPLAIDRAKPEIGSFNYDGVGRLKAGVAPQEVRGDLEPALAALPEVYPGEITAQMLAEARMTVYANPLKADLVGETTTLLWVLLGTVGFVLLIACANVANLLLVRAEGRQREMAVRGALGAGPRQLLASWLADSLLLAAAGGALGLLLAYLGVDALLTFGPENLPRRDEIGIDAAVLAFTAGLTLSTGILFGLLPLIHQRRAGLAAALSEGRRGATAGRQRLAARNVLVTSQVALALVLLVGSGLMVRSFARLSGVDPGFDPRGILTLRVSLPAARYADAAAVNRFYAAALERIRALPGVAAAGAVSGLPLTAQRSQSGLSIEDFPRQPDGLPPVMPNVHAAPGYFEALHIPVVAGRTFEPADNEEGRGVAVVSQAFARRFWPRGDALGERLQMGLEEKDEWLTAAEDRWLTIVGVVGDVRHDGLAKAAPEMLYLPLVGRGPGKAAGWVPSSMGFTVRTTGEAAALARPVRDVVWSLDPDLPIANVETMEQVLADSTASTTFAMTLLVLAAGVALVLGAIGLYGVIAYVVSRRTREIGVRMALGAERGRVARLVVGQGLALVGVGLALGLGAAAGLTRLLGSLLFEVSPTDPPTFAAVAALLAAVCLAAAYLPARRAAAVEPVEALRSE